MTEKTLRFDGTITAGNLITLIAFLISLTAGWMTIKSDIQLERQARIYLESRFAEAQTSTAQRATETREAVKELSSKIDRVLEAERERSRSR